MRSLFILTAFVSMTASTVWSKQPPAVDQIVPPKIDGAVRVDAPQPATTTAPAVVPNGSLNVVPDSRTMSDLVAPVVAPNGGVVVDNQWRYRWHDNRWWYWLPSNRWVIWNDSRWIDYDPATYAQFYVGPYRYQTGYRGYYGTPYSYGPNYYRGYYPRNGVWVGNRRGIWY